MNPYLLSVIAAGWLASVGSASYFSYNSGADSVVAFNAKADAIVRETREAAQQGAAKAIAGNRPKNTTIVQEVRREVENNPVYRDCVNTAGGLSRINAALTGQSADTVGGFKLPRAVATP